MNKKKFLKILEEKLQILSEEERNDILNEYKDTIEEKVRHGSSEEEAVADFGSIEELSREILKAYKINPDYSKNKDKVKEFVEDGETLIKKGAEKLSSWTQDTIEDLKKNDDWTLEKIFEVIIKAILLLIGLSLLRIPFYLIESLGIHILGISILPFDTVFRILVRCLISILYFVVCIIIGIIVFKPYFENDKKIQKKKINNRKNEKQEIYREPEVEKKDGIGNTVLEVIKVLLFVCTVFPLYFVDFGCYIALAVLVYLIIEGIPLLGVFFILLGITIFFTFLTKVLYNLIYGKKKIYCYSLIVSAIFFVSGIFLSISTLSDFEFIEGLPENNFSKKEIIYHEKIAENSFHLSYWDYEIKEDETLEDDNIDIMVSYYSDFIKEIKKEEKTLDDSTTFYKLKTTYKNMDKKTRKNLYRLVKRELKDLRWYRYSEIGNLKIVIKANSNTIDKIK